LGDVAHLTLEENFPQDILLQLCHDLIEYHLNMPSLFGIYLPNLCWKIN